MPAVYADLRVRLAQVEALISEQESRLRELQETKSGILTQLEGATYPVLTLPGEITSQIFLHCLPQNSPLARESYPAAVPHTRKAPLLLLQICSAWRSIAISTPRLWDVLNLDFERPGLLLFRGSSDSMMELVDAWFSRAGNRPLSLGIWGSDLGGEKLVSSVIRVALPRYASRLQDLALHLTDKDFKRIVDIGPLPLLEKITVGLPFLDDGGDIASFNVPDLNISGIVATAPRLSQLTLAQDVSPSACLKFPWKQLTTFTCQYLTEEELFSLLCDANSLLECTCSVQPKFRDTAYTEIIAPRLQTLRLVNGSATDFLPFLRLPVLQNLHLSSINDIENDSDADTDVEMDQFLSSHLPSFLHRTAAAASKAAVASVEWLSLVSELATLELRAPNTYFLQDFILKLNRSHPKGKLFLPHLHTLVLLDCPRDITPPLLQAFSSRSAADAGMARLESFRQIWPRRISPSLENGVVGVLRGLVASGMKVHVGSVSQNEI